MTSLKRPATSWFKTWLEQFFQQIERLRFITKAATIDVLDEYIYIRKKVLKKIFKAFNATYMYRKIASLPLLYNISWAWWCLWNSICIDKWQTYIFNVGSCRKTGCNSYIRWKDYASDVNAIHVYGHVICCNLHLIQHITDCITGFFV